MTSVAKHSSPWRSRIRTLLILALLVLVVTGLACSSAAAPTAEPTPREPTATAEPSPTPIPTPTPTTAPPALFIPNPAEVPMVNLDVHSVPLEDIVFDTFRGGFVRLDEASESLIENLRDAISPICSPG